jgi:hypothetical protein
MPYHGTPAFKNQKLDIFILKTYAATSTYREFAITIAHELSHVVLESIQHPLRTEEKAVDLTAMLLGFSYFYRTTAHAALFAGLNRVGKSHLGYLNERELDAACRILVPPRLRVQHALLDFAKHGRGLFLLLGICFMAWAGVTINEWWMVHEIAVVEQAQLERLIPIPYGSTKLTGAHVWLTSLIKEFTVDTPYRRFVIDFSGFDFGDEANFRACIFGDGPPSPFFRNFTFLFASQLSKTGGLSEFGQPIRRDLRRCGRSL